VAKITVIRQGESLPFVFDRSGESLDDFVCTINVKQFPADAASISRVIEVSTDPATGDAVWSGFLTSTETSALNTGLWYITAILVNSTDDEEEAVPVRFQITVAWA